MRTISFDHGEPRVVDVDNPRIPGSTDVLVSVRAASINGSDLGILRSRGVPALIARRIRPGFDVAGIVVACGSEVTAFEVGDRVMALLDHSGGGQAELVTVPQRRAAVIPSALSDVDAAAIPLAGLTALQALRGRGRLSTGPSMSVRAHQASGRRVLVNGAAGGIGSFAIQLAKAHGAHVTAITGHDRFDYVTDLGADATRHRVANGALPEGERFDLILDVPGALRVGDTVQHLTPTGLLVSTRPVTPDIRYGIGISRVQRQHRRFAVVTTSASSQDLSYLARSVENGRLIAPIDRVFSFADSAEAYARASSGSVRGKVILVP